MRLDEAGLTRWGDRVGRTIARPAVLALRGPLGAGKSVLARAVGAGAGVSVPMPSPSFNVLMRYKTPSGTEVVHMDLYRIESPQELWELGWADLGTGDEILIVEWPENAGDLMPRDYWLIDLSVPRARKLLRDVEVHRVGSPPELAGFPMSIASPRA